MMSLSPEQQDRALRAVRQLDQYTFIRKPGRVLVRKGNTEYTVTKTFCTCPDFLERCEPKGEVCKHMLMVAQTGLLNNA